MLLRSDGLFLANSVPVVCRSAKTRPSCQFVLIRGQRKREPRMDTSEHEIVFEGEGGICFCAVVICFCQAECPLQSVQLKQDLRVNSC